MRGERPVERERAGRGLGARDRRGQTTTADPRGRLRHKGNPAAQGIEKGARKARGPAADRARRRTVRDNPEGSR